MTRYFGATRENQSCSHCIHKKKGSRELPCWLCKQTRSNFKEMRKSG